jgi:hypothetical protein
VQSKPQFYEIQIDKLIPVKEKREGKKFKCIYLKELLIYLTCGFNEHVFIKTLKQE